jgi:HPt (histidine-containing phosphotransfer) domain-containing protein
MNSIDPATLDALRELNPEDPGFLRELIDVYIEDLPLRLAELEKAIATQDAALLTRAAHTIKGSSGNFGAAPLAAVALTMEKQGKAAAFADAATTLPELKAEADRVVAALKTHR